MVKLAAWQAQNWAFPQHFCALKSTGPGYSLAGGNGHGRGPKGVILEALWACTFHTVKEPTLTACSAHPGAGEDTGVGKGSLTHRGTRPLLLQQGHGCRNTFCIAVLMTDAVPQSYAAPTSPGPALPVALQAMSAGSQRHKTSLRASRWPHRWR